MLELSVVPPPDRAFVGESLPVRVLARNVGATPIVIRDFRNPLRFVLRDERGLEREIGQLPHRLSPVETPPRPMVHEDTIAPGQSREFRGDPADFAYESLRPGRWEFRARLAGTTSEPFVVTLRAPTPTQLARACDEGRGLVAFTIDDDLFVRNSYGDPDHGVAVRQLGGRRLEAIAVGLGLDACFLALVDGALGAGSPGHLQLLGWLEGPRPTVEAPRLLERAIFLPPNRLVFVVAGVRAAQTATVLFARDDGPRGPRMTAIELGPETDAVIPSDARLHGLDGVPHALFTEGPTIVAVDVVNGARRTLFDASEPIRAFRAVRDALLVVTGSRNLRVAFDGAIRVQTPLPPLDAKAWAAGASPAALLEDRIVALQNGAWADVAPVPPGARALAVIDAHWPREWVQWLDPDCGLRHAPIGQ